MIKKIFRFWPKSLLLHNQRICFPVSFQQMRLQAQMATKILQKIIQNPDETSLAKQQNPEELVKLTLRQKIIKQIQQYSKVHNLNLQNQIFTPNNNLQGIQNSEILNNFKQSVTILNYFTIGGLVSINNALDERFKDYQAFFKKMELLEDYKILLFIPTYITTHQLWRYMYRTKGTRLITGQFGMGKSHACLLYKIISDYIYRYRLKEYLIFQQQMQVNKSNRTIEQISSMYKINHKVNYLIPKIIYLSLNNWDDKYSIQQRILNQCFELTAQQINKIKNATNGKYGILQGVSLKTIYKEKFKYYPIKLYLIFDQVGVLASMIRKNNKNESIMNQKNKNLKIQQKKKVEVDHFGKKIIVQKNMEDTIEIKDRKRSLYRNFDQFHFLSSTDIEYNILQTLDLNSQHEHQPIKMQKLSYSNNLQKKNALLDLIEFIGFEFQEKLRLVNLQQINAGQINKQKKQGLTKKELLDKIKISILKILKTKYKFTTPLFIQKFFTAKKPTIILDRIFFSDQKSRQITLNSLIDNILSFSQEQLGDKFSKFIKKYQNHQMLVIKAIILMKMQIQIEKRRPIIYKYQNKLKIENQKNKKSKQNTIINQNNNQNGESKNKLQSQKEINKKLQELKNISIKLKKPIKNQNVLNDKISKDIFTLVQSQSNQIQVKSLIPFQILNTLFYKNRKQITQLQFIASKNIIQDIDQGALFGSFIEIKFKQILQSFQSTIFWSIKGQSQKPIVGQKSIFQSFIYKKPPLQYQNGILSDQQQNIYGFVPIRQDRQKKKIQQTKIKKQNQDKTKQRQVEQFDDQDFEQDEDQYDGINIQNPTNIEQYKDNTQRATSVKQNTNKKLNSTHVQYQFLKSFKQFLDNKQLTKQLKTYIFYPVKSNLYKKIGQIAERGLTYEQIKSTSQTSKAIDFVVAEVERYKILLNLYDIAKDQKQLISKTIKFLKAYINLGDKFECQYIDPKKQGHQIKLNYIIFTPNQVDTKQWRKKIVSFFEKFDQNRSQSKSEYIDCNDYGRFIHLARKKMNQNGQQKMLLEKIAHVTFNDLRISQVNRNLSKSVQIWKQILQKMVYNQNKSKKQSKKQSKK